MRGMRIRRRRKPDGPLRFYEGPLLLACAMLCLLLPALLALPRYEHGADGHDIRGAAAERGAEEARGGAGETERYRAPRAASLIRRLSEGRRLRPCDPLHNLQHGPHVAERRMIRRVASAAEGARARPSPDERSGSAYDALAASACGSATHKRHSGLRFRAPPPLSGHALLF